MRLTLELHVGCVEDLHFVDFDILSLKYVVALFDMRVEHGNEFRLVEHRKRLVDRAHKIVPQIRDKTTQGVRETWTRGNEDLGNAKLARQRGRMERPCSSESQKDEVAGIMST
jgi:hypothetical protein